MAQLDERLVRVRLTINGQAKSFTNLYIASTGCKYANPLQNEATVRIANLSRSDRDYLLTECSPFNKNHTPKSVLLEAGRVSTGLGKIFEGNIVSCKPSQPPDIMLDFKCQTGAFTKGRIVAVSQPAATPLSTIAQRVANDNGLTLRFEAKDRSVSNYSFTGGALKQIERLAEVGAVNAYADDHELIVKDYGVPLVGQVRVLSPSSGLVGIPETTEQGIKATYMLDNTSKLGGALDMQGLQLYPALNGRYTIYKLGWNITSRENPFYWIAECQRRSDSGAIVKPNPVPKHHKGRAHA